jgi:hypothetical protein
MEAIMNTGIEFLSEPFIIKESDKMELYRFNVGDSSPYMPDQKWNYQSNAVRTNNSEGIYALADGEHCLSMVFHTLRENLTGEYKGELIILKMNVDKRKIIFSNHKEYCFSEGNIIEKLSIYEFIKKVHPKYSLLLDYYRMAMAFPNEVTKANFLSLLDRIGSYHALMSLNIARMSGREIYQG